MARLEMEMSEAGFVPLPVVPVDPEPAQPLEKEMGEAGFVPLPVLPVDPEPAQPLGSPVQPAPVQPNAGSTWWPWADEVTLPFAVEPEGYLTVSTEGELSKMGLNSILRGSSSRTRASRRERRIVIDENLNEILEIEAVVRGRRREVAIPEAPDLNEIVEAKPVVRGGPGEIAIPEAPNLNEITEAEPVVTGGPREIAIPEAPDLNLYDIAELSPTARMASLRSGSSSSLESPSAWPHSGLDRDAEAQDSNILWHLLPGDHDMGVANTLPSMVRL